MKIKIRDMTGKEFSIEVNPGDTIDEVKEKIFRSQGIPVAAQKIILNSNLLEGGRTLADYDVEDGGTLMMLIRPYFG